MSEPTMEELRAQLETALKQHDWFFDRADDPRYYAAGREQRTHILSLAKKIPDGIEMFESYRRKMGV